MTEESNSLDLQRVAMHREAPRPPEPLPLALVALKERDQPALLARSKALGGGGKSGRIFQETGDEEMSVKVAARRSSHTNYQSNQTNQSNQAQNPPSHTHTLAYAASDSTLLPPASHEKVALSSVPCRRPVVVSLFPLFLQVRYR